MLIDWFTVGAQALNFIILIWLLKRFLYKPILDALHAREERIARELADADAKKAEARRERDEYQHKNDELDARRAAVLSKATEEAKEERRRLIDEAQQAANALRGKRAEALVIEARNLDSAIKIRAQQEVFAIAKKVLTDLAAASVEERTVEVFTRRLRELEAGAKAGLGEALKGAPEPAVVRSAFELSTPQRDALHKSLNEAFSDDVHVRFETAPELICGIELTTRGQRLAWSIADYLASLEKGVRELIQERVDAGLKAEPASGTQTQAKPEAPEPIPTK